MTGQGCPVTMVSGFPSKVWIVVTHCEWYRLDLLRVKTSVCSCNLYTTPFFIYPSQVTLVKLIKLKRTQASLHTVHKLNTFRLQVGGNIRVSGDLITGTRLGTSSTTVIYESFMKTHAFVDSWRTKNILSVDEKKKEKISIFLVVERLFYVRVLSLR